MGLLLGFGAVDGESLADHVELSFANGDTSIRIDAHGHGAFGEPDKTILVDGVDLSGGDMGQAAMLQALLVTAQLVVTTDIV